MKQYTKLGFARYYCRMNDIPFKALDSYRIEVNRKIIDVMTFTCSELLHAIDDAICAAENEEAE